MTHNLNYWTIANDSLLQVSGLEKNQMTNEALAILFPEISGKIGIDRNLIFRLRPYRTVSSPMLRPYTVPYRTVGYGQKTV